MAYLIPTALDLSLLQFFNGSDSLFLDGLMTALTDGLTWIPLYLALLYMIIKNSETMGQICLTVGCLLLCIVLADGVADGIAKPLFARLRPSHDPLVMESLDYAGTRGTGYSFFSAHAANTMALAVFLCLLVRGRIFNFVMVSWALLNGYTRLYLGVHYPSDVLVGFLWGAASGFMAYLVWRKAYFKISPKVSYASSQYTRTGYALADADAVIAVMAFTIIYSLLFAVVV